MRRGFIVRRLSVLVLVLVAARGCATARRSTSEGLPTRARFPVTLRVVVENGQPKVYAPRTQVEAAIGKKLPAEGGVSARDLLRCCLHSSTPPDSTGNMTGELMIGFLPTMQHGSAEILIFGADDFQPGGMARTGYLAVRLQSLGRPISDWAIVEIKER